MTTCTAIPSTKQSGFGLMEVLVAMLVLSIGLLGLAGLQLNSLQNNQEAYVRSQANYLVNDLADRMRANLAAVEDGEFASLTTEPNNPGFNCATSYPNGGTRCSAAEMATADFYLWYQDVEALLPGGAGQVCNLDSAANNCPGNNQDGVHTIRVSWTDPRTQQTGSVELDLVL